MKTIILAIDLSDNTTFAIHYSAALAASNRSKLVLVHAIPLSSENNKKINLTPAQLELYYLNEMIQIGKEIRSESGYSFKMEALSVYSPLSENLNNLVHRKQVDLVILGTKRNLINSGSGLNALEYLQQAICPVLIIPEIAAVGESIPIIYASESKNKIEDITFNQLNTFAASFSPNLNMKHLSYAGVPK